LPTGVPTPLFTRRPIPPPIEIIARELQNLPDISSSVQNGHDLRPPGLRPVTGKQ
jgi:hypothetical protein